jgi:DNA-binding Xre family transcriptional regulator
MQEKHATTYTLRTKGNISGSTILRLQHGESVSTNTLDALCEILECEIEDIICYAEK